MALPPCHSRRTLEGESNRYFCAHPRFHSKTGLVTGEVCLVCPLWREPPPAAFRPDPGPSQRGRCQHLGEQAGLRECPSCRGSVRVKVFACRHPAHLETTLAECAACADFRAAPAEGPQPATVAR
jgi:hypothetical protein